MQTSTKFSFDLDKLIEYWASGDNIVSCNLHVGLIARVKISFSLLSICTDELRSIPKIMTFSLTLRLGNENFKGGSNPRP